MKTITKGEAAKRWGIAPSMVTKYVKRGMPVTGSGRLNWTEVQEWRREHIQSERSGSFRARQRAKKEPTVITSIRSFDPRAAYRQLLDLILARRHLVPEILAVAGCRDRALLHCSDDLFATIVLGLAGEADPYDWSGDDIPAVTTDIEAVFKQFGLEITPEVITAADKMADAAFEATDRAMKGMAAVIGGRR